jgi:glycosyltransferase involved in cell wall biosynthesis
MAEVVARPRLLVLASTYPRWKNDHEPSFVHELARRLVDRFEVVVVCPHAPGAMRHEWLDGVRVERYRYAPARFETLVNDGGIVTNLRRTPWKWLLVPGFMFMQWAVARREVRARTTVHAHWILIPGLVARLLSAPFVVTSHGADLFALRGSVPMTLKRFVVRRCRALTVVSAAMQADADALLGNRRSQVSPMGVDLRESFVPDPTVEREAGRILFVGRLVEKKGVEVLLHALPSIIEAVPHARLTIVGFGPLEGDLRKECSDRGLDEVVTFAGAKPQDALARYYQSAAAFVAPFRPAASGDQEGLGLVLVEALGCGCPVVTSDVPAVRDVVSAISGATQVPPGDVEALARAVIAVLLGDAQDKAAASRALLMEKFDWDAVARRYAELLSNADAKASGEKPE